MSLPITQIKNISPVDTRAYELAAQATANRPSIFGNLANLVNQGEQAFASERANNVRDLIRHGVLGGLTPEEALGQVRNDSRFSNNDFENAKVDDLMKGLNDEWRAKNADARSAEELAMRQAQARRDQIIFNQGQKDRQVLQAIDAAKAKLATLTAQLGGDPEALASAKYEIINSFSDPRTKAAVTNALSPEAGTFDLSRESSNLPVDAKFNSNDWDTAAQNAKLYLNELGRTLPYSMREGMSEKDTLEWVDKHLAEDLKATTNSDGISFQADWGKAKTGFKEAVRYIQQHNPGLSYANAAAIAYDAMSHGTNLLMFKNYSPDYTVIDSYLNGKGKDIVKNALEYQKYTPIVDAALKRNIDVERANNAARDLKWKSYENSPDKITRETAKRARRRLTSVMNEGLLNDEVTYSNLVNLGSRLVLPSGTLSEPPKDKQEVEARIRAMMKKLEDNPNIPNEYE